MEVERAVKKLTILLGIVAFLLGFIPILSLAQQKFIVMDNGLRYLELKEGDGAIAETGKIVVVHLIGWRDDNAVKGVRFISTYDRGKPLSFKLGTDKVMKAWSEGVQGMKTGGKRRLFVPSILGYGGKGVAEIIPPNADLVFDVELLEVK